VTEVTVRATFFLLTSSLVNKSLEDGHFGQLAHLADLLTGLTPSVGPWCKLKGQRRRPERVPACPDFFPPNGTPFRSGNRRVSGLARGLWAECRFWSVQHPIWGGPAH
jgi:hypothetical protein